MRNVMVLTEGSGDSGADRAWEGACRPRSMYVQEQKNDGLAMQEPGQEGGS